MAPTIQQVMLGIETQLQTIPGLRVSEYVPDQVNPPAAIVGVPTVPNYRMTLGRGRFDISPTVTVLVSATLDRVGQLALAAYADPTGERSVCAAIELDRTLGAIVDDCVVDDFRPLGLEEVGQIGYYGGVFTLRVIAPGR